MFYIFKQYSHFVDGLLPSLAPAAAILAILIYFEMERSGTLTKHNDYSLFTALPHIDSAIPEILGGCLGAIGRAK